MRHTTDAAPKALHNATNLYGHRVDTGIAVIPREGCENSGKILQINYNIEEGIHTYNYASIIRGCSVRQERT